MTSDSTGFLGPIRLERSVECLAAMLVGVSLLGIVGCVRYEPQPLDPVDKAGHLTRRTLSDPSLKAFVAHNAQQPPADWPPAVWDLTQLTLAAFYFHPDLDVARAEWAVAQAGQRTAGQRPNPSVDVAPGLNATQSTPSPWILTSLLDLTVETAHKRGVRQDQARRRAEAARLHIAAVAWQVRSRVRRSLVALYAARETLRLLELQQALQDENVRRIEQRYAAGDLSAFVRAQARLAADQARLALHDAERQAAEATVSLAAAVGLPPDALEGRSLSFEELNTAPSEAMLTEARVQALFNRADLLGVLADYAASEDALRLEIAKQYPDLHLGPGYEFDQGDSKWSVGLSVSLPFFNRNRGPIAEAEARRTAAAARFDALQLSVLEEVARATTTYQVARQKMAAADTMATVLQTQEQRAEALLASGEISEADLVALRLEVNAIALERVGALSEVQQALSALEDALQSPLGLPPAVWQNAPRTASPPDNIR